jgi:hypothetical protein
MDGDSEYEPKDSRNVTGTAATPDGRWTNEDRKPPAADGEPEDDEDDDPIIYFEPDPELTERIDHSRRH